MTFYTEFLKVLKEVNKNKFNPLFYIYVYLTFYFWKKIVILLILINGIAILKLIRSLLISRILVIDPQNPIDVAIYKILVASNMRLDLRGKVTILLEVFFRYLMIFIFNISLKSAQLMVFFFSGLMNWKPTYSYSKWWKIHRFFITYVKKEVTSPNILVYDMKHKILGDIFLKIK